jgi:Baseplate J-like protein
MAEKKAYMDILLRDGCSRQQRLKTVLLNNQFILADERSEQDLLLFAKNFSAHIEYFDLSNKNTGDWKPFFDYAFDDSSSIAALIESGEVEPSLALYLAFIRIFKNAQNQLNKFTQRHLDYYYHTITGLQKAAGVTDSVYVIFELAKNITEKELPGGTLLNGGKNADGTDRLFALEEDTIVNGAVINYLRTVSKESPAGDVIRMASTANSLDGMGKELPKDNPTWYPFGHQQLPATRTGMAVAGNILLLKEGLRNTTATFTLNNVVNNINSLTGGIPQSVVIYYTGEKGWLGPFNGTVTAADFNAATSTQHLIINSVLTTADGAVTAYDSKLHGGSYNTAAPVMQILADTTKAGNLYGLLQNATVSALKLAVTVTGIKNLVLENDAGVLDGKKPFMPFGAQPKAGSSFFVGYDELLHKKVDSFSFDVNWLSPPASFNSHYNNYFDAGSNPVTNNNYYTARYYTRQDAAGKTTSLFNSTNAQQSTTWPSSAAPVENAWFIDSIRSRMGLYKSEVDILYHPFWGRHITRGKIRLRESFSKQLDATPLPVDKGFIRFELQKDFFHSRYALVFASKMKTTGTVAVSALPNEPYSPSVKSMVFNYTASTPEINIGGTSFSDYTVKELQFFHVDVFGTADNHGYLKQKTAEEFGAEAPFDRSVFLFPRHTATGELLIGVSNIVPGQTLRLLLQLAEGTANPESDTAQISWYVLCSNEWRMVQKTEMLKDETADWLQSGIIELVIPAMATNSNTVLDSGYYWIKAQLTNTIDAVCKLVEILPQAAKAKLSVADVSEYIDGVVEAGSITKLVNASAEVKKILQPYASFGGKSTESNEQFYVRVSERMRHKQRGITNWDYEHIVLQQFEEVYKVKCLNHSAAADGNCCTELNPGHVTLILVPDIRKSNGYNPLEPKVSLRLINSVKAYMQQQVSFFTEVHVENPEYEKIQLDFFVKFTVSGNFGLYQKKLNDAVKSFLTPWAFNSTDDIAFGGTARKSVLLNFIEELEYVDFLTNFKMFHIDAEGVKSSDLNEVKISNPRAILVSHEQHIINEFTNLNECK